MKTWSLYFFILIIGASSIISCQKEIDGLIDGTNPVVITPNQKPKVGTTWTYRYEWFNSPGGLPNTKTVYHKAKSEETLGGEKWLKIVDVETDTVVYYLNTKTDGLYQYTNNNPYIVCKYPAAVNDTYTTFFDGGTEDFTVRGVDDTLATGVGDIPLTKCEGVKNGFIIDVLWYNKNVWVAWKYQYKRIAFFPPGIYYIYTRMYIDKIVY